MRNEVIAHRGYDPSTAGDELSLKIASYPETARYLAERLAGEAETVCELCCGIGISLIELSKSFQRVIGIDCSEAIVKDCNANLKRAHAKNYTVICADVSNREVLRDIQADIVLYDIPFWSSHAGQVDPSKQNPDLQKLVSSVRKLITRKIVVYCPTSMTYQEVRDTLGECEFLQVFVNGKHDRNFIFLGDLVQKTGTSTIELQTTRSV